jgi:hypothetical protein
MIDEVPYGEPVVCGILVNAYTIYVVFIDGIHI